MKWKIPLFPKTLRGYSCGISYVTIRVRTRYGTWAPLPFVVDTGADFCTIPIVLARREAIAFPQTQQQRSRAAGLAGDIDQFVGSFHILIGEEEFDWPCNFLTGTSGTAQMGYGVLGRAAFLAAFTVCIDEPYLYLQRRLNDRPWWYRLAAALIPRRSLLHHFADPL
jgi:hypothetical protein